MPSTTTPNLPDLSGKTIEGGLRLLECVGSGSWGKVYRAIDLLSPVDAPIFFAVKCLLKAEIGTIDYHLQLREFTNHQAVSSHPNVVSFHRIVEDDSYTYVVLDYCGGGDLFQGIVHTTWFDRRTDRVKAAFLQAVEAVMYCHQSGVYHRDLKPENILRHEDSYYLADFGLSTLSPMSLDHRCGSWEYMSPECIAKDFKFSGKKYSTRKNDVWALGIILINIVTRRNPWERARLNDPCFKAFVSDPGYFLKVLPISVEANDLLRRILVIDPASRMGLGEMKMEIEALGSFFPQGCEDGRAELVPIYADDTSPRTSCLRRSDEESAPTLSCAVEGAVIGGSFIGRIADAMERVDPADAKECTDLVDAKEHVDLDPVADVDIGPAAAAVIVEESSESSSSMVSSQSSLLLAEEPYYRRPNGSPLPTDSLLDVVRILVKIPPSLGSSSNSSSSSAPSLGGPITPETHAVECDVAVPDMDEDANVDVSFISANAEAKNSKIFKRPAWVKDVPKSRFFKRLVSVRVGKGTTV